MSLQTIINYDNASNFSFPASKIAISGSKALLILEDNPSQAFNQDFASDSGFNYDNNNTEFSGGQVQQKDTTPTDSRIGCTYSSSTDASWNKDGSVTGTINGSATVSGGKLDCTGNSNDGVSYDITHIGAGAIKFKYTPNYTGNPPNNVNVIGIKEPSGNNNRVLLTHSPSGDTWRIWLNNNVGTAIYTATTIGSTGVGLVDGTEYEIELNWDNSAGTVRLFQDGVLYGTLSPGTWPFTSNPAKLIVGADNIVYNKADAEFDDVVFFNTVQHTTGYTPGYSLNDTIYLGDLITLPVFSYSGVGSIQSFDSASSTEANNPRYIAEDQYWNGSAWVSSDDTFAQANTLADLNTNISSLSVVDDLTIKIVTDNGNSQMSVNDLTVNYTGQIYPTDDPTIIVNSGILMDGLDNIASVNTQPVNTALGFVCNIDSQDKYHNGSNWVNSDGSLAQSNTIAEILTNKATLPVSSGATLKMKVVLNSDGSATPDITSITIDYDFFIPNPTPINECIVHCNIDDIVQDFDVADLSAKFIVKNKQSFSHSNRVIAAKEYSTSFDSNGYAELSVIETTSVSEKLDFCIQYTNSKGDLVRIIFKSVEIPDQSSINILDLTTIIDWL